MKGREKKRTGRRLAFGDVLYFLKKASFFLFFYRIFFPVKIKKEKVTEKKS